ncbi:MAG: hypothetical protein LQ338_007241 [Usnochroma carphineum]|nr:MAG: hypothetical protein LQ338_007241 [Usnochroma carphineum]
MPSKKKRKQSSKTTSDQQTITQMDPFKEQLHPRDDREELALESPPTVGNPSRGTRRRRISHTPAVSTVQTRSARKKAAEAGIKTETAEAPNVAGATSSHADQGIDNPIPDSQGMRMPPPVTPKRVRRKVVPSSQSPTDTTFSSHRKRFKERDGQEVTTLQERSVNTPSQCRLSSRRKTVQWAPKLEVADSTNLESGSSGDSSPRIVRRSSLVDKTEEPSLRTLRSPPKPRLSSAPKWNSHVKKENPKPASACWQGSQAGTTWRKGAIAADSEDDDDGSLNPSPEKRYLAEVHQSDPALTSATENNSACSLISPKRSQESQEQDTTPHPEDILQGQLFETVPTQLVDQSTEPPSPVLKRTSNPPRTITPNHPFDSEETSAQLKSEPLLSSSPPPPMAEPTALETESQFENAWREFTPPQPNLDDEPDFEPTEQSNSPTLPSPTRNNSSADPQTLPPIPPSQATTTDITQTTPHHTHTRLYNNDSQILGSSPPLHRVQTLLSSSPLQIRKEPAATTAFTGYQGWNGVQLTDSQLLPQSLLDDSLVFPPIGRDEEGLEMEEE